jgi:7-carboxy-7-deazaguanine synthase
MQRKTDKIQINEIFTSIEGEGIFFGTKTMFVRMAGCPLNCFWCDTTYALSMKSGHEYTLDHVKNLISKNLQPNTYKVNFTGGEPLVQYQAIIDLAKFIKEEKRLRTYIESSCFDSKKFEKVLPYIDICKIEFKMSDSKVIDTKHYVNLLHNEIECLALSLENRKTTYIKVVITGSTEIEEFKKLLKNVFMRFKTANLAGFIIQPSYGTDEPTMERLFNFYDIVYPIYQEVRIIPQLHKVIGIR